ncbi:helix-turn-helix transcriptional regulator [Fodinicola acaciae]|uniref:helix-turn-helix transcriptional regulator n=1 Tax=Fodinicola acaciae TaxID=2681555 RepID=UPI0013D1790C|nr:WYL domain-containing protein [Fodinicola acaciae]
MWDTPGRLLRLLELLQQRHDWSGPELAGRLGVSTRTVRRDVDRLRAIGYPVDARHGAEGGYHLAPGANLPPLMYDSDEAVATVLALQAYSGSDEAFTESAVRALTKLVGVMPRRLRRQAEALTEVRQTTTGTIRGQAVPAVSLETLVTVAVACRERRRSTATIDGEERTLDPLSLVRAGRRWHLVAWDVWKSEWLAVRLDDLRDFSATDRPAAHREPPGDDLVAYVVAQLGRRIQQVTAVVEVAAPAAKVAPWVDGAFGRIEPTGDESCVLHCGADSFDSIASWLLLFHAELKIVRPPELAEAYRRLAEKCLRHARSYADAT